MKTYGFKRRDKLTCRYGCCRMRKNKRHIAYMRRAKKAARRINKDIIKELEIEEV